MCHQTVGLAARHLEANGIPTLIIGSARDIIDEIAVPRFAFTDLPLGNPVGPADDAAQQQRILHDALAFAASTPLPQSSVVLPVDWNGDPNWRDTYMSLDDPEALRKAGEDRRSKQRQSREKGGSAELARARAARRRRRQERE